MGRVGREPGRAHHPRHRPRGRPPFRLLRRGDARDRGAGRVTDLLRLDAVTGYRGGRILFEGLSLRLRPGAGQVHGAGRALADEHPALDERQRLGEALAFWGRLDGADPTAAMEAM